MLVERPWGHYEILSAVPSAVVKQLVFNGENSLSHQRHRHRTEVWTVVSGRISGTVNDQLVSYGPSETFTINPGDWHQFTGSPGASVIEIWLGDILEEDDIERR